MKIAITGASGFIGRHTISYLDSCPIEIVAQTRTGSVFKNIKNSRQILSIFDIANVSHDPFELLGRPDALIHLAWGGLPNYRSNHHIAHELPIQIRFLRKLLESGLKTLVVAGTCFEYGLQIGKLSETQSAAPITPYSTAKDLLRRELEALKKTCSYNLVWARLFYMYGRGQSETSIYSQLSRAVEGGEIIFRMSLGEQTRDYLEVSKVASYLVRLAALQRDVGIVNVCSGIPITMKQLVHKWIALNNWNIQVDYGYYPYPDHEPMHFWGDNKKLRSLLCSPNN